MLQLFKQTIILIFITSISACVKDRPSNSFNSLPNTNTSKVLILCEGSLGNGNSRLDVYQPHSDSLFKDVYYTANQLFLGDILQNITAIDSQYFLCINNSNKVIVINKTTFKLEHEFTIAKPRVIAKISNNECLISSLFSNKIAVVNTQDYTVKYELNMPYKNIEDIKLIKDKIAIACWDTACNYLYYLNPTTYEIIDSVRLSGAAPNQILTDKNDDIWALSGNVVNNKQACFSCIDPHNNTIKKTLVFANNADPQKACMNPDKDSIYYLEVNYNGGATNNGVFRMNINANQLPENPFIPAQNLQYFWALGIDPHQGYIYIGDPKGFTQSSQFYIYNQQGVLLNTHSSGVGLGHFYFE